MQSLYSLALAALLLSAGAARAQSVGIGTAAPDAAAALDIRSTDKGLLIPRLTEAQRLGMGAGLPAGLMVFQTDGAQPGFWYYFSGQWLSLPNQQAAAVTAENGLTKSGAAVQLGGALTQPTTVAAGTQPLTVSAWPGTYQPTAAPDAGNAAAPAGSVNLNGASQTFTVLQSGLLRELRVTGDPQGTMTGTTTVRVELQGPLPATTPQTSVTTIATTAGLTASLPSGLAVQAGQQYRLVLSRLGNSPGSLLVSYSANDAYSGGQSSAGAGRDLLFSVGVQLPSPEAPLLHAEAGRVGVGTGSPQAPLHVVGASRFDQLAGTGTRLVTADAAGNLSTQTVASVGDNLGDHTATEPLKYNANDGDKLLLLRDYGATGPKLAHGSGWTLDYYAGPSNNNLGVHRFLTGTSTGWQERLRIANNGNVGIGTSSPQQALDVNGTARATGFVYTTPLTYTYVVTPADFRAVSNGSYDAVLASLGSGNPQGVYMSGSGVGNLAAPLRLPAGAVVTQLQLRVIDNDGSTTTPTQLRLSWRRPEPGMVFYTGGETAWATLAADNANIQEVSLNTNVTIDNSSNYYLQFQANRSGSCALQSVIVTYTLSRPW
ncbi:hypothetical protein GCM10027048_23880 [Hymenobacter coalescens]